MENKDLDYQAQRKHNEEKFREMVTTVRPEIGLIMDTLDQTGINPFVIWKVIYAMNNIAMDTKYGQVNILIENNLVRFIRGEHSEKLNMSIFKETLMEDPIIT